MNHREYLIEFYQETNFTYVYGFKVIRSSLFEELSDSKILAWELLGAGLFKQ